MANESLVMTAEVRDNFSGTLRKLQNELRSLSNTGAASTKTLQKDWKGVGTEIQGAAGSITRDMLPAMQRGNLAGLALGGTIGLAAAALKNFASETTSLSNFSKEIGLSAQELAKLKAQAGFFGQDWMNTQQGLRTFQDFMNRLKNDSGQAIHELRVTFGVAGDELARKLLNAKSMEEASKIAFDAIKATGSESQARKIAQAIFGNESWARIIRETTPELEAEFGKVRSKVLENEEAAKKFNLALQSLKITAENLRNDALTPILSLTAELIEKFKEPIGQSIKETFQSLQTTVPAVTQAFKDLMQTGGILDFLKKMDELTSSSTVGGLATRALKGMGIVPGAKPLSPAEALAKSMGGGGAAAPTTADTNRKLDSWNRALGAGAAPGSPTKDIPKTNEELRQTNEKLNTSVQKQTSAFDKFIAIIGQGGDTAGLGPGLGGVSGGGGGLGGAGALRQFRDAVTAGGGGPSIRRGAATGGSVANAAKFGQVAPRLMNRLMTEHGLTREQAAGVVGNLGHESGGFKHAEELAPNKFGTRGLGWAQWTDTPGSPRRTMFENWSKQHGLDPRSDEASERYLFEGDPQFKQGLEAVKRQSTTQGSMQAFEGAFERAGVKAYGSRLAYANRALAGPGAPPAALGDLRVKGGATGGGDAAAGVVDLSRYAQSNIPGFNRVTAMNDRFHQFRGRSAHNRGLATDFTIDDPRQSAAAAQQLREHIISQGLDPSEFKVLDEYKKLSRGGTGGHLHAQFQSEEAAARYRKSMLLQQQQKADQAKESKLEATGTVNVHLHDSNRNANAKVDTEGMFKDVKVNRGRAMSTAEDYSPLGRAAAGF